MYINLIVVLFSLSEIFFGEIITPKTNPVQYN